VSKRVGAFIHNYICMEEKRKRSSIDDKYLIPASIIVAGFLVAGGLYLGMSSPSSPTAQLAAGDTTGTTDTDNGPVATDINIQPVSSSDHIRGNADAPVKIVEFSDFECPFCDRFHPTLQEVMQDYDGQVAWVYRHFPLDSIHSNARPAAEASECVAALGGNDAFWTFADSLFANQTTGGFTRMGELAAQAGVSRTAFDACVLSNQYAQNVSDDLADATASGGRGTPHSVVIAPNGKTYAISGAQPYSAVAAIIDLALQEN
jgi:protein-disulfide isomerase